MKIIIFLLSMFFLFSCKNGSESNKIEEIQSFHSKENLGEKGLLSIPYGKFVSLEGEFGVVRLSDDNVVIYTETDNFRHLIVLNSVGEKIDLKEPITRLRYMGEGVLINNNLFLRIKRDNLDSRKIKDAKVLSKNNNLEILNDYKMIAYRWYSKNAYKIKDFSIKDLIALSPTKVMNKPPKKENKKGIVSRLYFGANCDSGGPGASECSYYGDGGCSVSCNSGYACCNWEPVSQASCVCIGGGTGGGYALPL